MYLKTYNSYVGFLFFFGIWLKEEVPIPLWYKAYSICLHLIMGLHNMALIIKWSKSFYSFKAAASIGYIIVTCITGQIKILLVLVNRGNLLKQLKQFRQDSFTIKNQKEAKLASKALHFYRNCSYLLLLVSYSSVILLLLLPYFWQTTAGLLPFPAWYPFNYSSTLLYEITYTHQGFVAFLSTTGYNLVDIMLSGTLEFIGLQCLILCERVSKIGTKNQENVAKLLIDCVEHHKNILRFVFSKLLLKSSDKLFGKIYFWQLISSTLTLCLNLFLMSLTNTNSFEFGYLIVYQVAIGNLLLMPCWFASEMTRKSEKMAFAAYNANWPDANKIFKKDLAFFICMLQKPLKIYAISFFEISVVTFVSIYKAAWGYYAVLNNVNTDNA